MHTPDIVSERNTTWYVQLTSIRCNSIFAQINGKWKDWSQLVNNSFISNQFAGTVAYIIMDYKKYEMKICNALQNYRSFLIIIGLNQSNSTQYGVIEDWISCLWNLSTHLDVDYKYYTSHSNGLFKYYITFITLR